MTTLRIATFVVAYPETDAGSLATATPNDRAGCRDTGESEVALCDIDEVALGQSAAELKEAGAAERGAAWTMRLPPYIVEGRLAGSA